MNRIPIDYFKRLRLLERVEMSSFYLTRPLNSSNHQTEQGNFNQLGDFPKLVLCCPVHKKQRIS